MIQFYPRVGASCLVLGVAFGVFLVLHVLVTGRIGQIGDWILSGVFLVSVASIFGYVMWRMQDVPAQLRYSLKELPSNTLAEGSIVDGLEWHQGFRRFEFEISKTAEMTDVHDLRISMHVFGVFAGPAVIERIRDVDNPATEIEPATIVLRSLVTGDRRMQVPTNGILITAKNLFRAGLMRINFITVPNQVIQCAVNDPSDGSGQLVVRKSHDYYQTQTVEDVAAWPIYDRIVGAELIDLDNPILQRPIPIFYIKPEPEISEARKVTDSASSCIYVDDAVY